MKWYLIAATCVLGCSLIGLSIDTDSGLVGFTGLGILLCGIVRAIKECGDS